MQCRLHIVEHGDVLVVRIAGRVTSEDVPELLRACLEAKGSVRVDLTEVLAADPIVIDALRRVREAGAALIGVPRYMQFKLDSISGADGA